MENKQTPEELAIAASIEYKKNIEARIESEVAEGFLNPFGEGVSYDHFLKACGGKANVESYCKGKITDEQLAFLLNDLTYYKVDKYASNEVKKGK